MEGVWGAMAVVDAVAKTVPQYVPLFQERLEDLFATALRRVPGPGERHQLMRYFDTWRTWKPQPVFSLDVLDRIAATLPARDPPVPPVAVAAVPKRPRETSAPVAAPAGPPKRAHVALDAQVHDATKDVLLEIDSLWGDLAERVRLQGYPATPEQNARFHELQMMRQSLAPPAAAPAPPTAEQAALVKALALMLNGAQQQQPLPPMHMYQQPGQPYFASSYQQAQPPPQPLPPVAAPVSAARARPAPRYSSYLPPVGAVPGGGGSARQRPENDFPKAPAPRVVKDDFRDLHVFNARALEPLYHGAGERCKQCGMRFMTAEALQSHADWHFKQNEREKNRGQRQQSRSWYVSQDVWHQHTGAEVPSIAATANPFEESSLIGGDALNAAGVAGAATVSRVPRDDARPRCAICHAEWKSTSWSDERETWMLDGVLEYGSSLVHVDCFESATDNAKAAL